MTEQLYEFRPDGEAKCCMCNFRTTSHYVVAESQEAAEAELDRFDGRSLCGDCMCQKILQDGLTLAKPT